MSTRRNLLLASASAISLAVMGSTLVTGQQVRSDRQIGGPDTFPAHKGTINPAFKPSDKAIKGGPSPDMRAYPTKKGGPGSDRAIQDVSEKKAKKGSPGSDRAVQDVSDKKAKKGSKGGERAVQDVSEKKAKKGKRAYPQGTK